MNEEGMMTRLAHAGENAFAKKVAGSVSVPVPLPIYMSSVFAFDDAESVDAVYEGNAAGYVYSRMANPSAECAADILQQAEQSGGALVFSSGMAGIITAILSEVQSGDHVLASPVLYGGVYDYLKNELPRFGVEVTFANFAREDLGSLIKPNTKILYTETITNPLIEVENIPAIAEIAHAHGCKLIVDNTFATPAIAQPLKLGADIAVYSATKYLGGHSDITGGAITSSAENIARIQRLAILYGSIMGPFEAFLLSRSLRTLDLRVKTHSANALLVAQYLETHPKIERVYYPGLMSSPFHQLAGRLFYEGRCGGMLSADIAGGEKAACAFIRASEHMKLVPSLAGVSTTISYPAKTSHRAYSPEELRNAGISAGQLRFSIGLEQAADILSEFDRALKAV